ncbi:MAG: heme-binding protein [Rhodobiaceae bacterium]|nr:heme-binding protein [Rhodobiaceae bacterium]
MSTLTLDMARAIVRAALAHAGDAGFRPMAVAVVDTGGRLVAFERSDGAAPGRFELALGKAVGCAMIGTGGRRLAALSQSHPGIINAASAAFSGQFVPAPGGVILKGNDGAVIGAVGASGDMPENDEAAAIAGIESAGLAYEA